MPDRTERVAHRQHERRPGLEDAVDLAQRAPEVGVVVERVVGDDDVDRPARREAEVGQLAVVALHGDAGPGGRAAQVGDAVRVGVEGDRLGTGFGEGDGVAGDAELDDAPPAADVTEQVQVVLVGHARAVGHVHARQCAAPAPDPGASVAMRGVVRVAVASLERR